MGEGVYFWESSPARALDFARERAQGGLNSRGEITDPFVIGAVLNLGRCFSTTELTALNRLQEAYEALVQYVRDAGIPLPLTEPRSKRAASIARISV